jgi:hypothetical protein
MPHPACQLVAGGNRVVFGPEGQPENGRPWGRPFTLGTAHQEQAASGCLFTFSPN